MLKFNTRLTRRKFIIPWLIITIIGLLIFIGGIIFTVNMFNKIDAFISLNWPNGYYTEEMDTFLNSLANDTVVHNTVRWCTVYWFCFCLYILFTSFPYVSLTIRRLHDVSKSGFYLPISLFFIFKESDIFENQWGKPE